MHSRMFSRNKIGNLFVRYFRFIILMFFHSVKQAPCIIYLCYKLKCSDQHFLPMVVCVEFGTVPGCSRCYLGVAMCDDALML